MEIDSSSYNLRLRPAWLLPECTSSIWTTASTIIAIVATCAFLAVALQTPAAGRFESASADRSVSGLPAALGDAAPEPQVPGSTGKTKEAQTSKADNAVEPAKKATVSFEMLVTNHMLVDAKINSKGPFRLIFDLGAPVTLLSNRASEAAGVVKPDAPRSFLFGMRGEAEVNRLQVGDLTADKIPVIVLDHPVLTALEDVTGKKIDGIMGFTFFARFKTTIDYHARQMTFEPISYQVRNLLTELPNRLMGPKVAQRRVLAPSGLWGLRLGETGGGGKSQGAEILKILPGSSAAAAGLKAGDVLTVIDGRWVTSVVDAYSAAAKVPAGQQITIVISRDGKELTFSIKPADGI